MHAASAKLLKACLLRTISVLAGRADAGILPAGQLNPESFVRREIPRPADENAGLRNDAS